MKYRELINELYSRRTKGIKIGLDRVQSVLEKLGNPHKSFKQFIFLEQMERVLVSNIYTGV
jgi:Folylpolyglutamate synthase